MTARVVVFGEALVDLFSETPGRPLREVDRFVRRLGGAPANVAVGLARLGVPVLLSTRVGDDELGAFVRGALEKEGVDVSGIRGSTARTGLTLVSVAPDGERSFLFYRHPSADQCVEPADLSTSALAGAAFLHFGSSTLSREPARAATRDAVRRAREAGLTISFDANLRPHLWAERDAMRREALAVLSDVDIVKVNEEEMRALTGANDVAAGLGELLSAGPDLAVVTLAERGSAHAEGGNGGGIVRTPGFAVRCVDATGAGDGFCAGLLASLADSPHDVSRAMRWANAMGALAVTALGATAALPRRAALESFLASA